MLHNGHTPFFIAYSGRFSLKMTTGLSGDNFILKSYRRVFLGFLYGLGSDPSSSFLASISADTSSILFSISGSSA
jgi:high-affinity nickel permease